MLLFIKEKKSYYYSFKIEKSQSHLSEFLKTDDLHTNNT